MGMERRKKVLQRCGRFRVLWCVTLFRAHSGGVPLGVYRRTGFKCERVIIANYDFYSERAIIRTQCIITHSINQYVARA